DGNELNTGLSKVGCFMGDMSKTAIGSLIYSGKFIGVSSNVFGTVSENVPSFTLYNGHASNEAKEVYFQSAVETQRRMMARRNVVLTPNFVEVMKSVFDLTRR